jgi:hypothetical protein
LSLALSEFVQGALLPPAADLLNLRRPRGLIRVLAFVRGFSQGLRIPVDSRTLLYSERS